MRGLFFPVTLLATAALAGGDPCVTVTANWLPDGLDLVAKLTNCTEVVVTVSAELGDNVKSLLPATTDSAGRTEYLVGQFRQVDRKRAWRIESWHQDWKGGRPLSPVPPPVTYARPFRGKRGVLQRPHGAFSHFDGSQFEEAWDFDLPEGTDVLCARAGVVVGLRADSEVGGPDASYAHDANYVTIRHEDGTFANYAHLQHDGVLVKVGARVNVGQRLARSGNTGHSAGPHLHFDVFYAADGRTRVTLPVQFDPPLPE
jgi:murein DD-endopeptidase MepM/ murein hydrolase activator NlpD